MRNFALMLVAMIVWPVSGFSQITTYNPIQRSYQPMTVSQSKPGLPIYIQILKEERKLDLYAEIGNHYQLVQSFPICKFSGGLGPKHRTGDLKSPEGFYTIKPSQLNPESHYTKAINIGYPNPYDRAHGYTGDDLMIHGACVSIGCYAMTDRAIETIYTWVNAAFVGGQKEIHVDIFPFALTNEKLYQHRFYHDATFWAELKSGYDYFQLNHRPPIMNGSSGHYFLQTGFLATTQFQPSKHWQS